ncbi:IS4 family transposase [Nostoc sp. FACHB-110]|uniref:IS4 family transposase n=1 Tax=Nostoc sp. FACHB-110 TaxID=2692834 RepID=UPI0016877518|nr:IS4 family transposase [Nostoc sp. FACHB-110]MBD2438784.1 IS4 family transposase [Nostoc sp. FACHB-110]MBD2438867.1 IS4 family transposase [Nostoc sp. FACHB-110]
MSWAADELEGAELGDKRRNRRLIKVVEDLAMQPNESVPQASRDAAAMQGIYEFWANPRIKAAEILSAHTSSTVERIKGHSIVLAIQDTTELDFSDHRSKRGMGAISKSTAKGLKVHTNLAASVEGVPLGILGQKTWARDKSKAQGDRRRAIESKESQRWLESLKITQDLMPAGTRVITVADREADIYELFALAAKEKSEFLIRAAQNRNTSSARVSAEVKPLFEAIRQTAEIGQLKLELQRTPRRMARSATLSVRVTKLWLQPPVAKQSQLDEAVEVYVILAEEMQPPAGEKAICWLLLTTLVVNDFEQASKYLKWYSYRWLIERYHYCLKSGCQIEELQLEEAERIERALATYAIVAWRLLWLTYEARSNPEQPVEGILERHEWQSLYCMVQKTNQLPNEVPTLEQCIRWIASLGGFLGRKGDGDPGVKTLWRGLQRLHDIAATWQLLKQLNC